jgi:hypothetical protein
MSTATLPAARPEFVFVAHDASLDRPVGMPSDRERIAIHRAWLVSLDAGRMPASKVALLDRWVPGWRSDAARTFFGVHGS